MKATIPDPLCDAIKNIVYPVEEPAETQRNIKTEDFELTIDRRGTDIYVELPGRSEERTFRGWFGHSNEDIKDQKGSVNGFLHHRDYVAGGTYDPDQHKPEEITKVVVSISRATLVVESLTE